MKWAGIIGFVTQGETLIDGEPSGIWGEIVTEKKYTGDLLRASFSNRNANTINDGISISNQISFIADPYFLNNFAFMRYATFMGQKWKIQNVDFSTQPRVTLTLGELYNGQSNQTTETL